MEPAIEPTVHCLRTWETQVSGLSSSEGWLPCTVLLTCTSVATLSLQDISVQRRVKSHST